MFNEVCSQFLIVDAKIGFSFTQSNQDNCIEIKLHDYLAGFYYYISRYEVHDNVTTCMENALIARNNSENAQTI